jgi:uncharacterized Ntn-hydrolase superfamily protein
MTFSIAARCDRTGRFAVSVASSSPAVAARCAHARAGVGAVTTQNITDPRLGPQGLDLLALGADAETACRIVQQTAPLVDAMLAGLEAGGEAGPIRSCGLVVVDQVPWHVADLRVDWHDAPLQELARLWQVWQPQMEDYVTRALNPESAPSYGVAGDR